MGCIELEKLVGVAQGRWDTAETELVHHHIDGGCAACRENWAWAQKIVHLTAFDESLEPPEAVVRQAVRLFRADGPKPRTSFLRRLAATLTFDTLTGLQPAAVRQAGLSVRQCRYRGGQWNVDLSFEAATGADEIDVTGQVLKGDGSTGETAGIPVTLLIGEDILAATVTNALGEFTFDDVASGMYRLGIGLADEEVSIDQLDVRLSN